MNDESKNNITRDTLNMSFYNDVSTAASTGSGTFNKDHIQWSKLTANLFVGSLILLIKGSPVDEGRNQGRLVN